jgi:uncharacterized protein
MSDDLTATIAELICYPIKGCAGIRVPDSAMTPAGLAHDRTFMVVDTGGVFRTQRKDPRLATIRPSIDPDGGRLTLCAPETDPVAVAVDIDAARRDVWLFGNRYRGIDQGDAVAAWLTRVLGAPSRLVRVPPEHDRVTGGDTPGTSGYADSCPVLVLSRSSVDLLNTRLAGAGRRPVPADRFRPNIVVAGWAAPHTEDRVRHLAVGEVELGFATVAVRCAVITVDQVSGQRAGSDILRTLARYRRAPAGLTFGAKFAVIRPGRLAVGDKVVAGTDR